MTLPNLNKADFTAIIINEIKRKRVKPVAIRIHATGDFYSQSYLNKWIEIAAALPSVDFYAYTKRAGH
jgi:hypothetical protein